MAHRVFSDNEFKRRWEALREIIELQRSDLAVIVDADTIFYLTGFAGTPTTFQAILVPTNRPPIHLLRYAEQASFDDSSWIGDARYYDDIEDPVFTLANMIDEVAPRALRIAIEKASPQLSVARFELLSAALFNRTFIDISLEVGWQRLIRSNEEIEMHRRAAMVIERALEVGIHACTPGNTERDIGAAVASALVQSGADTPRIGVIGSGERLLQVHGGLSDRVLQPGDLVRLEMSNCVNRYWARIMRMVSLGEPSAEISERYELLRRLQEEQIGQMRPGAIPMELDAVVRERLPENEWAMQLTGYALSFHEPSVIGGDIDRFRIAADETRPLEAGMVLHVYVSCGQMSVSETVAISATGAERLTSYPRDIIVR
ncbi:MAG: Xaa-Pro peptidase family protein [Thermomicrobiales bacterium]